MEDRKGIIPGVFVMEVETPEPVPNYFVQCRIIGITKDREYMVVEMGQGIRCVVKRCFTSFSASDIRRIITEPDRDVALQVVEPITVNGIPDFAVVDRMMIKKL